MAGLPLSTSVGQLPSPGGLPDGWIRAELAALSACGPVRDGNEDRLGWVVMGSPDTIRSPHGDEGPVTATLEGPGLGVVIADGLGGHNHGELASRTAIGAVLRGLASPDAAEKPGQSLRTGFETANEACLLGHLVDPEAFDRAPGEALPRKTPIADDESGSGRSGLRGGQTTLTALALTGRSGQVAHVGDTRIFRLRDQMIELLTNDHTQARELLRMRVIKPEQVLTHPGRHLLTRSIGGDLLVRIEERTSAPFVGDVYLLCSDGLWSAITSSEAFTAMSGNLADGVRDLVARSAERGGDDNASVIALRITDLNGGQDQDKAGWRFPWRR